MTHGPFRDGYSALRSLARTRCEEALLAVLQVADPEPALELLDALRGGPDAPTLLPLLVHHSPTVKAAVLSCVPAGLVPVSDLIDVLAEDDPETALAAALALASDETGAPLDQLRTRRRALLDRAGGPDGPGRTAALTALSTADGADVEAAIRGALVSPDPAVREAAVSAGAQGRRLGDHELVARLSDESPTVRAAALRGLALRADRGDLPAGVTWRDGLVFLVDEPSAAAAAGAAVIALGGPDRPRLVEEMLAQEPPVRVAALEEIERTGDAEAARSAVAAIGHDDVETACAAVRALVVADAVTAAEALSAGSCRRAAAGALRRRGDDRSKTGGRERERCFRRPSARRSRRKETSTSFARSSSRSHGSATRRRWSRSPSSSRRKRCPMRRSPPPRRWPGVTPMPAGLPGRMAPARAERRWARALHAASRRRSRAPRVP